MAVIDSLAGMAGLNGPWRQSRFSLARASWAPLLLVVLALLVPPLDAAGGPEGSASGLKASSGLMGGTVAVAAKPKRLVYAGPTPQASSAIERESCRDCSPGRAWKTLRVDEDWISGRT